MKYKQVFFSVESNILIFKYIQLYVKERKKKHPKTGNFFRIISFICYLILSCIFRTHVVFSCVSHIYECIFISSRYELIRFNFIINSDGEEIVCWFLSKINIGNVFIQHLHFIQTHVSSIDIPKKKMYHQGRDVSIRSQSKSAKFHFNKSV